MQSPDIGCYLIYSNGTCCPVIALPVEEDKTFEPGWLVKNYTICNEVGSMDELCRKSITTWKAKIFADIG